MYICICVYISVICICICICICMCMYMYMYMYMHVCLYMYVCVYVYVYIYIYIYICIHTRPPARRAGGTPRARCRRSTPSKSSTPTRRPGMIIGVYIYIYIYIYVYIHAHIYTFIVLLWFLLLILCIYPHDSRNTSLEDSPEGTRRATSVNARPLREVEPTCGPCTIPRPRMLASIRSFLKATNLLRPRVQWAAGVPIAGRDGSLGCVIDK